MNRSDIAGLGVIIVLIIALGIVLSANGKSFEPACVFSPLPDITSYEVALILVHLNSTHREGVERMFRDHPELRRHMRDPDCLP